jgi:hypothetical protein
MTLLILVVIFALVFTFSAPPPPNAGRWDFIRASIHDLSGWAFLASMIVYLYLTFK